MKIEPKIVKGEYRIVISEAYSGLTIKTNEGKELNICLRDRGFDMNINGGKWHHVNSDDDFNKIKEDRCKSTYHNCDIDMRGNCGKCGETQRH